MDMITATAALILGGILLLALWHFGLLPQLLQLLRAIVVGISTAPFLLRFVGFWFISLVVLYYNAPGLYADPARIQLLLMGYLMFVTAGLLFAGARSPLLTMTMGEFVAAFVVFAAVGIALLGWLVPFSATPAELTRATLGLAILHGLVVAISEEIIFRIIIPLFLGGGIGGQVISGILFGGAHYTVYGGDMVSLAIAMGLGIIFGLVTVLWPRYGIVAAIAWHAAWNWTAEGIVSFTGA